ncbi:hypothetical protein BaRGS_00033626 [Batillaria attramentaria]|uniref:Uncharacterized protein n=1 Tax=Batillaria attramentaria TaxID=370345 RepID=A0ABD0JJW4_9CAEN
MSVLAVIVSVSPASLAAWDRRTLLKRRRSWWSVTDPDGWKGWLFSMGLNATPTPAAGIVTSDLLPKGRGRRTWLLDMRPPRSRGERSLLSVSRGIKTAAETAEVLKGYYNDNEGWDVIKKTPVSFGSLYAACPQYRRFLSAEFCSVLDNLK